jgi:hypothetical protein
MHDDRALPVACRRCGYRTRDGAKTRQNVLATQGRIDELEASGKLDVLCARVRDGGTRASICRLHLLLRPSSFTS